METNSKESFGQRLKENSPTSPNSSNRNSTQTDLSERRSQETKKGVQNIHLESVFPTATIWGIKRDMAEVHRIEGGSTQRRTGRTELRTPHGVSRADGTHGD